jgi:hypothetical protein
MFENWSNALSSIFKERTSSPFYGSFILSWCVCNWRIIYVTLFVDEELTGNKINYIERFYLDNPINLIVLPAFSTFALVWLIPVISNKAYKASLAFSSERRRAWEESEKAQLLTVEESYVLRTENYTLKEAHSRTINSKDEELKALSTSLQSARDKVSELEDSLATSKKRIGEYAQNNPNFRVVSALYGNSINNKFMDVTRVINDLMKDREHAEFVVNNQVMGGDPDPGAAKFFGMIYRDNSGEISQHTAHEHARIEITKDGPIVITQ